MITSPSPRKMAQSRSVTLRFRPPAASTALLEEVTPPSRLDDPDVFDHPAQAGFGQQGGPDDPAAIAEALAAHARKPRTVGVLLVRLGGYAAGVFTGYPPVLGDGQGRLAPGARPQRGGRLVAAPLRPPPREAGERGAERGRRRRCHDLRRAGASGPFDIPEESNNGGAAADGRPQPRATRLDAVVLGGDRRAVADLRDDPRLAPYFALATERFLTVPDPKRAVLLEAAKQFTAVRIWLTEP